MENILAKPVSGYQSLDGSIHPSEEEAIHKSYEYEMTFYWGEYSKKWKKFFESNCMGQDGRLTSLKLQEFFLNVPIQDLEEMVEFKKKAFSAKNKYHETKEKLNG